MGLLWEIIKAVASGTSDSKTNDREKEMDNYALEEWQKDLVRKGDYEPWNFEETGDLEEDDYYYEDDNNDET